MATDISSQYRYTGRGPLDSKALVKTYEELLLESTWYNDAGKVAAYNGMITAVWLDKENPAKNGVYFLHDASITNTFKAPDVKNEANWHKLGGINDLPGLSEQLDEIKTSLEKLDSAATEVFTNTLPETGKEGKLYVVAEEATTYIWHNGAYLPVGDGNDNDTEDIRIINGGSATN